MADTTREIERKYESGDSGLPDLTGVPGVASIADQGLVHLDATYYDTADHRLTAASLTLRRRTGGSDAGWRLKFPVARGTRRDPRTALRHPPGGPRRLVRSRVRGAALSPVVRLRSDRDVRHLLDTTGRLLAEISVDTVHAERLTGDGTARWTEIEVELADDGDPAFLDKVDKRLRKAGLRPSTSPSKLARALAETAPPRTPPGRPHPRPPRCGAEAQAPQPPGRETRHRRRPRPRLRPRPAGRPRRTRPRRTPGRTRLRAPHARRHPPPAQHLPLLPQRPRPQDHRPHRHRPEMAGRRARPGPRPGSPRRAPHHGPGRPARHPRPRPRARQADHLVRDRPPRSPRQGHRSPRLPPLPHPARHPRRPAGRPAPAEEGRGSRTRCSPRP
ncbi:CYTH domain-containing protein [Streptomyces sp. INA 01156]